MICGNGAGAWCVGAGDRARGVGAAPGVLVW